MLCIYSDKYNFIVTAFLLTFLLRQACYMFAPAVYLYGIPASMIIIAVSSSVKHFNLVHI